jgi:Holliday junction resolvase
MASNDVFWESLQTIEHLIQMKENAHKELNSKIENTDYCINNCLKNLHNLSDTLQSKQNEVLNIEPQTMKSLNEYIFSLQRAKDFVDYTKKNIRSDDCEIDLMERLLKNGIDSRYTGKTTAVDLFAKFKDKQTLIQVKSTVKESRTVTQEEVRDLLMDSQFFVHYPLFDIAFYADNQFSHYIVPIEEIMSNLEKKSITLTQKRFEEILSYKFDEFIDLYKNCKFPVMKYSEKQIRSWIKKVS